MSNLYQLFTKDKRVNGSYFFVNGPYDKHGFVLSSKPHIDKFGNKGHLNLIRGTENKKINGNIYNHQTKEKPIKEQKTFQGYDYKRLVRAFSDDTNLKSRYEKKWLTINNRASYRNIALISQTESHLIIEQSNGTKLKIVKD